MRNLARIDTCGRGLLISMILSALTFNCWTEEPTDWDWRDNWSVSLEIRDGHQLVTNGVYRLIRHPMYSSFWLWGIAQGTLLQNWLAGWVFLVAFALMYFLRTPRVEEMMSERFGDEYREYKSRTGRLIPRVRARRSP